MSKILSEQDLQFILHDWLKVDELCSRPEHAEHSRETFDDFLALSSDLATDLFAPHNSLHDIDEPHFDGERVHVIPEVKKALDAFSAAGLTAATLPESAGGLQLPHTVQRACIMWFQAANTGTTGYLMLNVGALNLLMSSGSAEQIAQYARPIADGRFFGIMCLSEPDVGSSLGDLGTRAVPDSDGTYRLFGTKTWISGGEHDLSENIIALVLARHEGGPAGVGGLSLFIVPKFLIANDGSLGERNGVSLVGLNKKMGYRGTVNTVLEFGGDQNQPGGRVGAVGYLVGEEGKGLKYMFQMMNEERISVGSGAAALSYTGYLHALDYARQRHQGRVGQENLDPSSPMVPIVEHADVRRMLLAAKCYAEGSTALVLYAARLLDEHLTAPTPQSREEAEMLLDILTPIAKTWPSQWGLAGNDHAIQIHGGYGYTRDFPVEQFWRDNRLSAIVEGTHGIQARDLLGRKVTSHGGECFRLLLAHIESTIQRAAADYPQWAGGLRHAAERAEHATAHLLAVPDPDNRLANAFHYLEAMGHLVVGWLWLDQALATEGRSDPFHTGKRAAAEYFFLYELPKVDQWFDLLESTSTLLVDLDTSVL